MACVIHSGDPRRPGMLWPLPDLPIAEQGAAVLVGGLDLRDGRVTRPVSLEAPRTAAGRATAPAASPSAPA